MDLEKLEKLGQLMDKGLITREEFEAQKQKLLDEVPQVASQSYVGQDKTVWDYFVECITTKYFCFEGRARRKEFWGYTLFSLLIYLVGIFLAVSFNPIAFVILWLALFLPNFGVTVRRLHDVNFSGWWAGLMYLGIWVFAFVILAIAFLKSDPKPNKYGPVPEGVRFD